MDILNMLLDVAKPTGVWPTIINAFESGVGSYLLAIVLITLILRVALSPFDVFNKRISKKQTAMQAKIQPEVEKLQKKYGNDKNLLNQKTRELYRKSGMSVGGSCLFMLVFMTINLLIFFSLFSALNAVADYKINQQYLSLKESYTNVLSLSDSYIKENGNYDLFTDYENLSIAVVKEGEDTFIKAVDKDGNEVYKIKQTTNFEKYKKINKTLSGDITENVRNYDETKTYTEVVIKVDDKDETYYVLTQKIVKNEESYILSEISDLYRYSTSDQEILNLVRTYVEKEEVEEGKQSSYTYVGNTEIATGLTLDKAIKTIALNEVYKTYDIQQKENSFLWIKSIWIADSPFKQSIFNFDQYKNEIGAKNVSVEEKDIYNSFMIDLGKEKGGVNGYFILAIISIGVSFLASWLGQLTTKQKNAPKGKSNKIMLFVMPAIMGIFAIFYNSVFAIYLVASQLIAAGIAPLSNLIINKWEEHDKKKEEAKAPVVDYRRK